MDRKNRKPSRLPGLEGLESTQSRIKLTDNSRASQRAKILRALEECGRLSTIEARQVHGIMHPAGRVRELRAAGVKIITRWCNIVDITGRRHRVADYILIGGAP